MQHGATGQYEPSLTLMEEPQLSADHGGFSAVPKKVGTHSTPGTSDTQFHSPLVLSGTSYQSHVSISTVGRGVWKNGSNH